MKLMGAVLVTAMALSAPASAAPKFVPAQSSGEQSVGELIGTQVQNAAGETLGDISYVLIDKDGKVSTIVVGVGGFLGVGEKDVGLPFAALHPQVERDGKVRQVLDASKEDLKAAPAFVWSAKPEMRKPNTTSE